MKPLIFLLCSWHFSLVQKKRLPRHQNQATLIVAHRGLTSRHLENTKEAIIEAFRHGADGVEFDVQLTQDLVPVVTHDDSLSRLCGVNKNVSNMSFAELRTLKQKTSKYEASYSISTLEEILAVIPPGKFANIELKESIEKKGSEGVQATLKIIEPYKNKLNIVISSFLPNILRDIAAQDSQYVLGYLVDDNHPLLSYIKGIKILNKVCFLNPHLSAVTQKTSELLKKLNIGLIFWGHHELHAEKYIFKHNHYALISDVADLLKAIRGA